MPTIKPVSVAAAKNRVRFWLDRFRSDLILDFGSANTRLLKNGELIWDQPTLIAWHEPKQTVLAVGQAASELKNKTNQAIRVVQPIKHGVVANLELASLYLQTVFKETSLDSHWYQFLPKLVTTTCPASASPVERRQLEQVLNRAGCQLVTLTTKSEAYASLPFLKRLQSGHGLIAVGAETLELAVYSDRELLFAETFYQPNHQDLTQAIQEVVLREYQLKIDLSTAQRLKHELATVATQPATDKLTVKGKDVQQQQIKTVKIEAAKLQVSLQELVKSWTKLINQFLSQISPVIMTQLQEQGFYLTGGGSQLAGLAQLLKEELKMPILASERPELDLVTSLWWRRQNQLKQN